VIDEPGAAISGFGAPDAGSSPDELDAMKSSAQSFVAFSL
jgi:hypothetical protein